MASKPRALLKQFGPKHKKKQTLDSIDDYQAAGVEFEDAAGKWRAGDATKSLRFFHRALEVYDEGLQKFPQSFDLAYNKARVQLEIGTHPILVKQLEVPALIILEAALESHRYALKLDQDNTDTLFNTAQTLTSIAEQIAKDDTREDTNAVSCLEEALNLQKRCLNLQELQYAESLAQEQAVQNALDDSDHEDEDQQGGVPLESVEQQEEQWFSVIEPVTQDTLIDTVVAQLGSLTTLCGIMGNHSAVDPQAMLAWIENYSAQILNEKIPFFTKNHEDRLPEIALATAEFISALLESGFRAGQINAVTYKNERDGAFSVSELGLEASVEALIANAKSLMSFSSALAESDTEGASQSTSLRWNALSAATTNLVTASKIAGISSKDLYRTHFIRGDCSMLQRQMSLPPVLYQTSISNALQLLKNAAVFYRNASKLSTDIEDRAIASFRSAMAQYLQQSDKTTLVSAIHGQTQSWMIEQIDDMIVEGLLPTDFQVQ